MVGSKRDKVVLEGWWKELRSMIVHRWPLVILRGLSNWDPVQNDKPHILIRINWQVCESRLVLTFWLRLVSQATPLRLRGVACETTFWLSFSFKTLVVSWEHKISPRDVDVQHLKWGSSNFPAASGVGEWGEISPSALEITPSVIWFHVETNHTPNGGVNVALRCTEAGA